MKKIEAPKEDWSKCGLQIGGYYSTAHFEVHGEDTESGVNSCVDMILHTDLEFPREERSEQTEIHLCDFTQLEAFVKYWGERLRKEGIVK